MISKLILSHFSVIWQVSSGIIFGYKYTIINYWKDAMKLAQLIKLTESVSDSGPIRFRKLNMGSGMVEYRWDTNDAYGRNTHMVTLQRLRHSAKNGKKMIPIYTDQQPKGSQDIHSISDYIECSSDTYRQLVDFIAADGINVDDLRSLCSVEQDYTDKRMRDGERGV